MEIFEVFNLPCFPSPENHRLFEAGHNTSTVGSADREQGWMGWQTICKVRKEQLLTYPSLDGDVALAAAYHHERPRESHPFYQDGTCSSRMAYNVTHIGSARRA